MQLDLRLWRGFRREARNFLLITFWVGVSVGVGGVLLNLYLVSIGYSTAFLGMLFLHMAVSGGLAAVPAGQLADRWGRRRLLLLGGLLAGAGQLVLLFFPEPQLLPAAAWLSGIGGVTLIAVSAPLLHDYAEPGQRTTLYSWNFAVGTLAMVFGSMLGGVLPVMAAAVAGYEPDSAAAYRDSLLIGLLIAGMAVFPLLRLSEPVVSLRRMPTRKQVPQTAGTLAVFRRPLAWKLSLTRLLIGLGAGFFLPYLNLFFAEHHGAQTGQIGMILAIEAMTTGLAGLAAPRIGRRLGRIRGVTGMQFAALPFLLLMITLTPLWMVALASWIRNALANAANPLVTDFAMEAAPGEARATLNSMIHISYQAGWAISAAAGGWLIEQFGYPFPYMLTAFCYLTAGSLYYIFFRKWESGN